MPQKFLGPISRRYSPWSLILRQNHTRVYRFSFENVSMVATQPKSPIVSWVTEFREYETVVDLCFKATWGIYSDRKESARTEENIAAVRDYTIPRCYTPLWRVRTRHSGSLVIPSSWLCLHTNFVGLFPTESLTAAMFSSVLAFLACPCPPLSFRVLGCGYALIS